MVGEKTLQEEAGSSSGDSKCFQRLFSKVHIFSIVLSIGIHFNPLSARIFTDFGLRLSEGYTREHGFVWLLGT